MNCGDAYTQTYIKIVDENNAGKKRAHDGKNKEKKKWESSFVRFTSLTTFSYLNMEIVFNLIERKQSTDPQYDFHIQTRTNTTNSKTKIKNRRNA